MKFKSFIKRAKYLIISSLNLLKKRKLNEQESSDEYEIYQEGNSIWSRRLISVFSFIISFGFIYSCIARIEEVVIAEGVLQGIGSERPIKSLGSSSITSINVSEGESVATGQILLKLDPELFSKNILLLKKDYDLELRSINDVNREFEVRISALEKKLGTLKNSYNQQIELLSRLNFLLKEGAYPYSNFLKEKIQSQEILSNIEELKANISSLKIEKIEKEKKNKVILNTIARQINENEIERKNQIIKSPIDGVVFNLIPSSKGYVTLNGETLMTIVPKGKLEAKIFISNKDIGFIKKEMQAKLRVDAYPFTEFGHVDAKVKNIAEGTLKESENSQEKFPAYLTLNTNYLDKNGTKYFLKSGQTVTANLVVRSKPVITLLTDALEKVFDSLKAIRT